MEKTMRFREEALARAEKISEKASECCKKSEGGERKFEEQLDHQHYHRAASLHHNNSM
jgi:hypothetical protein